MTTIPMYWGEMTYADSNNAGQPFLFLHGTGCDLSDWAAVIEGLPRNLRGIALNFRGHGQSTVPTHPFTLANLADDVRYLSDHLGLEKFVIVGHSLGGMVAMEVARRSSAVAGLVLLEGWTSLSSAGSSFDPGRFYGSLQETEIAQIQQKSQKTQRRFKSEVWDSFWESVKEFDGYAYLAQTRIPIYEVFGSMGRNATTEQELRIPPNPNIQWVWIPNAGHYLPHERPTEISKVIGAFPMP